MPGPLLVTDAPALLYRAFFALPDSITDDDGHPVNALLGSINQVLWCIEKYAPRAVVMCFGAEAGAYRVEAFPAYHADRPPMPDPLEWQWERAPALYESLGWGVTGHDELEADDLLHSLCEVETAAGGRTLILTGDRDLFQCAGEGVQVLLAARGGPQLVDAAEVERRYGVPPALVPDFIALRGDPSDGLPGARGVGEKTAADILRRHGSLEAALEAAADGTSLAAARDELLAFKEIATLRDLPVELPPDGETDRAAGAAAARELGMNRLAARLA